MASDPRLKSGGGASDGYPERELRYRASGNSPARQLEPVRPCRRAGRGPPGRLGSGVRGRDEEGRQAGVAEMEGRAAGRPGAGARRLRVPLPGRTSVEEVASGDVPSVPLSPRRGPRIARTGPTAARPFTEVVTGPRTGQRGDARRLGGAAEQPAGVAAGRPRRAAQHSDQCAVAHLLPLERRRAVRG